MKKESKLDKILALEFAEDTMDLKSKLAAITKEESTKQKKSARRLLMPALAVAASLVIAIVFLPSLFQGNSKDDLYASYYEPYPMALNQRGDGDNDLNQAISMYTETKYEESAAKFKALYDSGNDNVHLLYAASSEQANGNYQKAVELYDQVIETQDAKVVEQAKWYKALALWAMGDKDNAEKILRTLPKNHYKYNQAQEMLK